MIELIHGQEPVELTQYKQQNPNAVPADFDSLTFSPVKATVKDTLHRDQAGLCAYCEQFLDVRQGQVDHIKPKAANKPTQPAFPALAFEYTNFAHSCINNRTCGQKKKSGVLPIEPAPGCNDLWVLSSEGSIGPLQTLSKQQKHQVTQTRDMLGLNIPELVRDRKKWFEKAIFIAQELPHELNDFLSEMPFRHLMKTVF